MHVSVLPLQCAGLFLEEVKRVSDLELEMYVDSENQIWVLCKSSRYS